jgi:hypothetical protein
VAGVDRRAERIVVDTRTTAPLHAGVARRALIALLAREV